METSEGDISTIRIGWRWKDRNCGVGRSQLSSCGCGADVGVGNGLGVFVGSGTEVCVDLGLVHWFFGRLGWTWELVKVLGGRLCNPKTIRVDRT
jgi:hypothetical protein